MPFSAGLYVGWLASRLGLQMHARAVELDGRVVPVELREAEGAPHLGGIMRVTFHAPGRNLELVHRDECLELCTTGPVRIPRALRERAPELSRTALLVAELEGYHADPMLRAALPLSARFLS